MAAARWALLLALLGALAVAAHARDMPASGDGAEEQQAAQAQDPPAYKNTKPLIGILTQPCHECPGK